MIKKNKEEQSFFEKVYDVVRLVPYGKFTTYGAIANYLGTRGSARMVGWAMNSSHTKTPPIPAHRVVNRTGMLTGKFHFGGQNIMEELLKSEGIDVVDNKIVNYEKHFWDPYIEIPKLI